MKYISYQLGAMLIKIFCRFNVNFREEILEEINFSELKKGALPFSTY